MGYMLAIPLALAAVMLIAWRLQSGPMAIGAGVLVVNWGLNTVLSLVSGSQFHWAPMAAIDYASAIALLSLAATLHGRVERWQAAVVGIYGAQLCAHAAYGWAGGDYYYWWTLYGLLIAQIATTAIGGGLGADVRRRRRDPDPRAQAFAHLRHALGDEEPPR